MQLGPVELLAVKFPGNRFGGEVLEALADLVRGGTIRIVDLVVATRSPEGEIRVRELDDLEADDLRALDPVVGDVLGLVSQDDINRFTYALDSGYSVAILVFENTWATPFRDAVVRAQGELLVNERIPRKIIEELMASQDSRVGAAVAGS